MYQDIVDEFICSRGLPNIVTKKFAKELIKRNDIINGNNKYSSKWTPKDEKADWNQGKLTLFQLDFHNN